VRRWLLHNEFSCLIVANRWTDGRTDRQTDTALGTCCTVCLKKQYTRFLIITSANLDRFTKIIPQSDSWGNFVNKNCQDSPPHFKYMYVSTLPCETWKLQLLPISTAFCMWDLRIYLARYETALIAQIWIMWLQNLENNAPVLRRGSVTSANESSGCLTCNMRWSRLSLIQLAPVNGVNASSMCSYQPWTFWQLALTFRLYVSGRWTSVVINYKHYRQLLTMLKSFVAYTSRSLSSNNISNILALSVLCASHIAQKLIKSSLWYFCSVYHLNIVKFC